MGFLYQTQSPLWVLLAFLLSAFLFLSFEIIPFLGFLIGGFALTPLVLIWLEKGKQVFFLGNVFSSAFFLLGWGPGALFFYFLGFFLPATLLADSLQKEKSMEYSVILSTVVPLAVGVAIFFFFVSSQGGGIIELSRSHIQESISQLIEFYRSAGVDPEKIQKMEENRSVLSDFLLALSPSFFLISFFMVILANCLLVRFWFLKKGAKVFSPAPLSLWVLPDQWVWGLILSAFLLLLPVSVARWLGGNMILPLLVLYLLQGVVLVHYYLRMKKYPLWAHGLFLILLVFWPTLLFVIFLGIADIWADFRKVRQSPVESSE